MAAEWCEHEDYMLHAEAGGQHLAIHVKVLQLALRSQLKDWSPAGNVRLVAASDPRTVAVQITGPQHEWRADLFANHGYRIDPAQAAIVRDAGETVVFHLSAA